MKLANSARVRAGLLVVACVLVGGTGCVSAYIGRVENNGRSDRQDAARKQRIAQLTPQAEAGDAAAMAALAYAQLSARQPTQRDATDALGLLTRAAALGNVQAQALLGAIRTLGYTSFPPLPLPASEIMDRTRGIELLQTAATRACKVGIVTDNQATTYRDGGVDMTISPALRVAESFRLRQWQPYAQLWYARSILHCGEPDAATLAARTALPGLSAAQVRGALALLILTGDRTRIASASAGFAPEEVAAAEREAATLRGQVTESERLLPAPSRKVYP